jgi:hypothetical protein
MCLSDRMNILDLLKGSLFLGGVWLHYGKNESSVHSTALHSINPEHSWVFLNGGLLGTTYHGYQGATVNRPMWEYEKYA